MVSRLGLSCAPVLKAPVTRTNIIRTPAIRLYSNREVFTVIAPQPLQQANIDPHIFLLSKLTGADPGPFRDGFARSNALLETAASGVQIGRIAWAESVDGRSRSLLLRLVWKRE